MGRFALSSDPIVRIGNRMFFYWEQHNLVFANNSKLSSLGFEKSGNIYKRFVNRKEIDSAYKVDGYYGEYKGFKVRIGEFKENSSKIYVMFDSETDGIAAGIKPIIDPYDKCYLIYEAFVSESKVDNIYEVRRAAKGFPFQSPEIVYHKKDGKWLPWHELGTLLKDDEWL